MVKVQNTPLNDLEDPIITLQSCVRRTELSGFLEDVRRVLPCKMALHFSDTGMLGGIEIALADFQPEARRAADKSNPWQDKMSIVRPSAARFSDYVPERCLTGSGLYQEWLKPRGLKHGAMIAALSGKQPMAWITFYREIRDGDFNRDQMEYLVRLQRHFEAAVHRLLRTEGLPSRSELIRKLVSECRLSAREAEILEAILDGKTNAKIAEEFFIARSTVKVHVEHIFAKTNTHTRSELAGLLLQYLPSR